MEWIAPFWNVALMGGYNIKNKNFLSINEAVKAPLPNQVNNCLLIRMWHIKDILLQSTHGGVRGCAGSKVYIYSILTLMLLPTMKCAICCVISMLSSHTSFIFSGWI